MTKATTITNARVFDGEQVIDGQNVTIDGTRILAVSTAAPAGATVIDAKGGTLLPGLIDSHVHTDINGLYDALLFGVTTELEMQGHWTFKKRREIAERDDVADLRSSGMGVTPPGGHPSQYMKSSSNLLMKLFFRFPFVSTPNEAIVFVDKQVADGADYIKVFIEDGTTIGFPGLRATCDETLFAAVAEAHRLGKMAIAHVTTVDGGERAIFAGVDGLGHLFFDRQPGPELVASIASSKSFVVPTLARISHTPREF